MPEPKLESETNTASPARAPLSSLVVKPSPRKGNDASSSSDAAVAAACSSPTPATSAEIDADTVLQQPPPPSPTCAPLINSLIVKPSPREGNNASSSLSLTL
uniref:Uncharacterized protein n=1 Tax=Oryza sativa subsp. japonica TaxID=39947 RepID=Q8GVP2_ORYSJ|nr:hypothetical protein [Oryza sativa Japonica Group]